MRGTGNIGTERIKIDMSENIALLKPSITPVTVLLKRMGKKQRCSNFRFDWMEDDFLARWTAPAAQVLTDATSFNVTAGQGPRIVVGDLLNVPRTGEVLRVTAVAGDNVTVIRSFGDVAAAQIETTDTLLIIGSGAMQGSGAPVEKYRNVTTAFNYTQIFKTAISVTGTLNAMDLHGESELRRLQAKYGEEHKRDMEYQFLFGDRHLDTSGAQPVSTTGGLYGWLISRGMNNLSLSTANLDTAWAAFMTWAASIFANGANEKVLLASPSVITWLNSYPNRTLTHIQADNDKTFGLHVTKIVTAHGVFNLVMHPLFQAGYGNLAMALDMDNITYRFLPGRDTSLEENIQASDIDGRRDMYLTEAGLEVRLPQTMGLIRTA